ncbi:GAF and ANTAR domain-containing protein [Microbacterium sp. USTB-Y]|uniref:GAF and ANTAR domain-containing protein n=1 Tax=Microbacterium sp. USTB-Y TaxID=2823692 RepID=UPI00203A702E|nr:GAF and ANTAR domain-containing protein [Microbacterium sp. USTB-Y]
MASTSREDRLNAAFVMVADTLTDDYDVVELLHTLVSECTEIVKVQAGGLMLLDADGNLQVVASTTESAELVEVLQLAAGVGPCLDCFAMGEQVSVPDVSATTRWPAFREEALRRGFHSTHAIPLRLRGDTIGTMNLFGTSIGALSDRDASAAQALADVATISILQQRVSAHAQVVAEQLQRALDSRVLIEQAKGAVAQASGTSMDESFALLRRYARDRNLTLHALAEAITNRSLPVSELTISPRRKRA